MDDNDGFNKFLMLIIVPRYVPCRSEKIMTNLLMFKRFKNH